MTEDSLSDCPGCGVPAGFQHEGGCDVARCVGCGRQRLPLSGPHACADDLPMQVWTGVWPGEAECREWDLMLGDSPELTDLDVLAEHGMVVWDVDLGRFVLPEVADPARELFELRKRIVLSRAWYARQVREREELRPYWVGGPSPLTSNDHTIIEAKNIVQVLSACLEVKNAD